jgi:hypothetical protein
LSAGASSDSMECLIPKTVPTVGEGGVRDIDRLRTASRRSKWTEENT